MNDLSDIRRAIDAVDDALAALYVKRQALVDRVADAKRVSGAAVSDPAREQAILARIAAAVGPAHAEGAQRWFRTLFEISKDREQQRLARCAEGGRIPSREGRALSLVGI